MKKEKKSPIDELCKLLKEAGLTVSFDIYRDITKGCGNHCKAWAVSTSTEYCQNHKDAILRGDYIIPGSFTDKVIQHF